MRKITFDVSDEVYNAIQGYMKEQGRPFIGPFIKDLVCGMLGVQFTLETKDMKWFKHIYFVRHLWATMMYEYRLLYGEDEAYHVLSALMFPVNKLFYYSLEMKSYPLVAEMDAKLADVSVAFAKFVNEMRIDDSTLKVNKIIKRLGDVMENLKTEGFIEEDK